MASDHNAIGIDFGTSTSLAAEGHALRGTTVAPLGRAAAHIPTLLGISGSTLIAGDDAADLPESQIIRSIKNYITHRTTAIPHPILSNEIIDVDEGIVTVLRAVGAAARNMLDLDAETVRLGCPAMWDAEQRTRLIRLAQRAGIPVTEQTLIDEPIAAGMAWVSHRVREYKERVRGRLLVFDMGGGTLDVALLQVDTSSGSNSGEISVLSSRGVDEAGDRLDVGIRDDILDRMHRLNLHIDRATQEQLKRQALTEARLAKEMLSETDEVLIRIALDGAQLPTLTYTREQLEMVFAKQLDAAEELTWHVVRESYLTHETHRSPAELRAIPNYDVAKGVDHVLLAGGMSQIPAVRERLERMFPHAAIHARAGKRVSADEAIVVGLAETIVYDRVNLHRPPFDFLLELEDGRTLTLYRAHSPLYEGWQALQRSDLYYELVVSARELPRSGVARLRARSPMGIDVMFRFDKTDRSGIDVPLGRNAVRFRIRPNGRISITDGRGDFWAFRVDRWPVLRGRDHAIIQLERLTRQPTSDIKLPWHQDPKFE